MAKGPLTRSQARSRVWSCSASLEQVSGWWWVAGSEVSGRVPMGQAPGGWVPADQVKEEDQWRKYVFKLSNAPFNFFCL